MTDTLVLWLVCYSVLRLALDTHRLHRDGALVWDGSL